MDFDLSKVSVVIEKNFESARMLLNDGYIPIEASYGRATLHDHDRKVAIMTLDHHGPFSDLECPALRAQQKLFGQGNGKYVLSHLDNDSALTVLGLEGIRLPESLVERVAFLDVNGPHKVPEEEREWPENVKVHLMSEQCRDVANKSINEILAELLRIIDFEDDNPAIVEMIARDRQRKNSILKDTIFLLDANVAVYKGPLYPMDVLYAYSPIAVFYATDRNSISVGCQDEGMAERLLGAGGLNRLWPLLGAGWGGRSSIGGSPRGEVMSGLALGRVLDKIHLLLNMKISLKEKVNFSESYIGALRQELAVLKLIDEIN